MRKLSFILMLLSLLVVAPDGIIAQEANITTGGDASGTGGSVSYSVGQLVYQTNKGTSESLAEGVQQAYEISVLNGIQENDISLRISAYPNPVSEYLILNIPIDIEGGYEYSLFDMNGRIISQEVLSSSETEIDMTGLKPAPYFIKVSTGTSELKTFRIIKN